MRRIDDFMIDRVFQPIADRLEVWTNCYALAAFLATGSIVCYLVVFFLPPFDPVLRCVLVLLCLCAFSNLRHCHDLERRLATNTVPPDRVTYWHWRLLALALVAENTMFAFMPSTTGAKIYSVSWCAWTCSLYFCACQRRPPRREVSRSPIVSGASS